MAAVEDDVQEVMVLEDEDDNDDDVEEQLEGDDTDEDDTNEVEEVQDDKDENGDDAMETIEPKEEKEEADVKKEKKKKITKKKLLAYVSNLPFTSTEDDIRDLFKIVNDHILNITIFKYKRGASKGCCLIEFTNKKAFDVAMRMDGNKMSGRKISVERGVEDKKKKDQYALDLERRRRKIMNEKKKHKQSRWKIRRIPSKLKKLHKK